MQTIAHSNRLTVDGTGKRFSIFKKAPKATINISRRGKRGGRMLYRDNTLDAFNVTKWANESIAILYENMVMGNLVHRDFDDEIASFGYIVNTRRPGEFEAKRKTNADAVTIQNATAVNVPVILDQQIHVSYLIKDGEESIAFKSIIDEFLFPATLANAQFIDRVLAAQVYQFRGNSAGRLNNLTSANAKKTILDTRAILNANNASVDARRLVLTPASESTVLEIDNFLDASYIGDDGTALREASLGRKLGFDILMSQNMPYVTSQAGVTRTGAVNNAAGYGIGTTNFTVDGITGAITAGTFITIAGDDTPLQVVSTTGGAVPTAIVTSTGLKAAVVDNAVITIYPTGLVSGTYTYDSATQLGYAKEITISGVTVAPQVGQMVSFGSDNSNVYSVIQANGLVGVVLDRPLRATVNNGATINLGPSGAFNFAFHRNALALVTRPMAQPRRGTGALSTVVNWEGLSIRVVITYNGDKQGHLVTLDILAGVKPLDLNLGAVMYG